MLQKLLFVLIISKFRGLKLWKILRICEFPLWLFTKTCFPLKYVQLISWKRPLYENNWGKGKTILTKDMVEAMKWVCLSTIYLSVSNKANFQPNVRANAETIQLHYHYLLFFSVSETVQHRYPLLTFCQYLLSGFNYYAIYFKYRQVF